MAKRLGLLASRQVDTLGTGFHADGGNLYLMVKPSGARSWIFRYKKADKQTDLGLGSKDDRSLKDARELAGKMRNALVDGKDPKEILNRRDDKAKTFEDYAKEVIETKQPEWRNAKHAKQWEYTLLKFAYPTIRDKLPADVSLADVKAILMKLWATKTETASRLRQRIEAVLDSAAVHEGAHGRYNPARWKGNLDTVLPKPSKVTKRVHFAAAPYADVPRIMSALRDKDFVSAYCLRFTILTASRSGEARGALWSEIDIDNRTWTIPAHRMKANILHRVPLCDEAMQIVTKMQEWRSGDAERVFNGTRGGLLSDVAVNKTLHSVAPEVTTHGFRSSFRVWGAETTAFPSAALEAALAHVNPNEVEAAYQRSDLFERRVELMTAWGKHCADAGNVIQLVKGAA